jgi:hypothetical protein
MELKATELDGLSASYWQHVRERLHEIAPEADREAIVRFSMFLLASYVDQSQGDGDALLAAMLKIARGAHKRFPHPLRLRPAVDETGAHRAFCDRVIKKGDPQ